MKKCKYPTAMFLLSVTALFLVSPRAYAYLDPSTGSMVISAIVGILASIGLALKTYWYRVRAFFRRDDKKKATSQLPLE
jgi:hypothetical protein